MNKQSANLFILSAPSGTGKTSLVNALLQSCPQLKVSISHTTRACRPGERDGEDYFFIDHDTFKRMLAEQAFLEHAEVYGHHYGTARDWVQSQLDAGSDVILEIDWQGAMQAMRQFPDAVGIFLLPPSQAILEQRLRKRQPADEAFIRRRMQGVREEVSHCDGFRHILVNDDFDATLAKLREIVSTGQSAPPQRSPNVGNLIAELKAKDD